MRVQSSFNGVNWQTTCVSFLLPGAYRKGNDNERKRKEGNRGISFPAPSRLRKGVQLSRAGPRSGQAGFAHPCSGRGVGGEGRLFIGAEKPAACTAVPSGGRRETSPPPPGPARPVLSRALGSRLPQGGAAAPGALPFPGAGPRRARDRRGSERPTPPSPASPPGLSPKTLRGRVKPP